MRVSLQTSALVSIKIIDVNDNQPTISILFLIESGKPKVKVPENAKIRNRGEQQIYIIVFEVNVNLITIEIRVILINGHR